MYKRQLKHCYVKRVKNDLKKEITKHLQKKAQAYFGSWSKIPDIFYKNPAVPNYVMGFSNRAQGFTHLNYLGQDSPLQLHNSQRF